MPALAPDALIARHVEKLRSRPDSEKIEQLLTRAGISMSSGKLTHNGRELVMEDCYRYKRAVQEIYGPATYAFTKVNFVLGGCTCADCAGA
jgi:hypothetical protein